VSSEQSSVKKGLSFRIRFWDVLVGLPAGMLIFIGTVLFSTLIPVLAPYAILMIVTLSVGLLTGITRLHQGQATAFVAGLVAAGILGYLWLSARPGDEFNPLVIGPLGILTVLILCPAGGWLGAKLRKA
jgi:hypothetical protein